MFTSENTMIKSNSASEAAANFKQMQQHIQVLNDSNAKDEAKLQAAQQISDNLDVTLAAPQYYASFLELAMRAFLKLLQDGSPHFIAEQHAHQVIWPMAC